MSTDAVITSSLPENAGPILLALARAQIAAELLGIAVDPQAGETWLREPGASFVTLTQVGQLRGCIGTLEAHRALSVDVTSNAASAAFRDPRFKPLTAQEFDGIKVEVSVLSPTQRLTCRDEDDAIAQLRPGTDGVILEYGHHRSTFLPQVWEQINDPHLFLGHLKSKAGLPPDFWDPALQVSRYTVSKWRESTGDRL